MKLVIDVMGTDHGFKPAVNACLNFAKKHKDVTFILVGSHEALANVNEPNVEVVITEEFIAQDDTVISSRHKPTSSMRLAFNLVAEQKAVGVLSAGNTGVFVTLAYTILGLLENIKKPALMPFIPTTQPKHYFNLLDVGANLEVTAQDLVDWALMAAKFNALVNNKPNAKVGILNIGTEANKGHKYNQEAYEILSQQNSGCNFVGFVEPRKLLDGVFDIVVCDGYTGNIALKTLEGSLGSLSKVFKKEFKKPWNILAALFSLKIIKNVKKTFDYKANAGAIVLGVNGIVIKTHGSAKEEEFTSALELLYKSAKQEVIKKLQN